MICEKCMWKSKCECVPYSEECDETFVQAKKVEKISKKPLTNEENRAIINTTNEETR